MKFESIMSYVVLVAVLGIWGLKLLNFYVWQSKLSMSFWDILLTIGAIITVVELVNKESKKQFDFWVRLYQAKQTPKRIAI